MTRPLALCMILTALLTAPVGGCEPSADEELDGLIGDIVEQANDQNAIACDCWMELGYASEMQCTDKAILPARRRCIEDALAQDVTASTDRLDCLLPLEEEYTACLDTRLVCENTGAAQPCIDDYNLGAMECVNLPASVQRDYDDCFK